MNAGSRPVRIGIVDSGCAERLHGHVHASAAFALDGEAVGRTALQADLLGHGSRIADILLHFAPQAELVVAQVFRERATTSALALAAAIDWLLECEVPLINLSLGLRAPRAVLAEACARAHAAGVVLCAATPAHGAPVYPAAFPDVIRVTGDARCARAEIAALEAAHADFGAHVLPLDGEASAAGASMACAHVAGRIARHFGDGGSRASLRGWLRANARYHGVERLRR